MATKQEVTDFINEQFKDAHVTWWNETTAEIQGSKLSMIQCWMSPEIARILQKLLGQTDMVSRFAKNRSNS